MMTFRPSHHETTKMLTIRQAIGFAVFMMLTLFVTLVLAQKRPIENVSPRRHPNLASAQRLTAEAYRKLVAAQQANEFDLKGHATKAKELLDQANHELLKAGQCPPCDDSN